MIYTEDKIKEEENRIAEWKNFYKADYLDFLQQVDEIILNKDIVSYIKTISNMDIIEKYKSKAEFAYLCLIFEILKEEVKAGVDNYILQLGNNREEIIEIIDSFRFLLWRIEFAKDMDAANEFMNLAKTGNVSSVFINFLINTSNYDKRSILGDE